MALGGPPSAPSTRSWLGVARELTAGTALLPTNTIPQDARSYTPEDTPRFLPDDSIRGSMAQLYSNILGPEDATFSFGGPTFLDTYGFFLDNTFGDLSTTGTSPANGASLNGATLVGGTSAVLTGGTTSTYAIGTNVQIDTGALSEVVVLSAAWTSGTITFANDPLRFAHANSATVSTVTGPFTHVFALLNSQLGYGGVAGAQPPTHSLTDNTNLNYAGSPGTNTSGARTYPFACVGTFDLTGNAEQLLMAKFSGNSWLSAPAASAPTNTVSTVVPNAAWQSQVYVGGTSAGNLVTQVGDWAVNVKRALQVYFTTQGSANPYIIARGQLGITGALNYTAPSDETALNLMLANTQPQVRFVLDNGLSGTNHLKVQFDSQIASFTKSRPDRNAVLVGFQNTFESVANSTNVGGSGGLGPGTFTLINNVPTY